MMCFSSVYPNIETVLSPIRHMLLTETQVGKIILAFTAANGHHHSVVRHPQNIFSVLSKLQQFQEYYRYGVPGLFPGKAFVQHHVHDMLH